MPGDRAPRRRQYGTGSVFKRASDDRWVGQILAGVTPRGTTRYVTVSYKAKPGQSETSARAEVTRRLEAKRKQLATTGLPVAGVQTRTTVRSWSVTWLEQHRQRVRASSYTTDAGAVHRWIVPTLGARRLEDLTPADVRALTRAVTDAGRSTTTARHAQSVLSKMLRAAILEGHAVPQRVLLVEAPPRAVHDRDAIPLPDALALLTAAAERPDASRWVAALLQGMRQGECLGLTWDAVDLDTGVVIVEWQLDTLPYLDRAAGTFAVKPGQKVRHLEGAWHLTETKTAKGQRVIPLVPWMRAALAAWRELAPASRHDLVWPRLDGRPRDEKDDRREWQALQDAAGVRHASGRYYTVHEARHTTATLLLEAGVDDKVIEAILGHSSITTSRGYMHVNQALARRALDDVATRLGLDVPALAPVPEPPTG